MEATTAPRVQWTFAQWGIVILAGLQLAWAVAGLITEPSFHFGEGAPTKVVLGVDFNGVHALSGFLLFGPAFFFALKPRWALLYAIFVAAALIKTLQRGSCRAFWEELPALPSLGASVRRPRWCSPRAGRGRGSRRS
ncbi:MAG TPA: hypothetical protein VHU24_10655 [Solirubrobacterales bacterium]|jgi:hypothetical protein|nr:hypothetical protein [Solirubrobacterales bacterium]